MRQLRYLLLQVRNAGDPMADQEIRCFARALNCRVSAISVFDLIKSAPSAITLQQADMLLLGGSGHYSIASRSNEHGAQDRRRAAWTERTLDVMREVHHSAKPTFASCWGFQAMARAMGGECVNDIPNAEVGTVVLQLTEAGRADPIFSALPGEFAGQAGHEDRVVRLPENAVLLASSLRVKEQAFRFTDLPIYCTQFHPELDRTAMMERVIAYPKYIERIARVSFEEFIEGVSDTPEANSLLRRFVLHFFP